MLYTPQPFDSSKTYLEKKSNLTKIDQTSIGNTDDRKHVKQHHGNEISKIQIEGTSLQGKQPGFFNK